MDISTTIIYNKRTSIMFGKLFYKKLITKVVASGKKNFQCKVLCMKPLFKSVLVTTWWIFGLQFTILIH